MLYGSIKGVGGREPWRQNAQNQFCRRGLQYKTISPISPLLSNKERKKRKKEKFPRAQRKRAGGMMCWTETGEFPVRRNRGAILPFGRTENESAELFFLRYESEELEHSSVSGFQITKPKNGGATSPMGHSQSALARLPVPICFGGIDSSITRT